MKKSKIWAGFSQKIFTKANSENTSHTRLMLMPILALLLLSLVLPGNAHAGTHTMIGSSEITAEILEGEIKISGSYQIENKGTEVAKNVFPALSLGGWAWAGDTRSLNPNSKEIWELNVSFKASLLERVNSSVSVKQDLPSRGQLPLIVLKHYEDVNGTHFSAADVVAVTIGVNSPEELNIVRTPDLNAVYSCSGNGHKFSCNLELLNTSDFPKKVLVSYHASQELQLKTLPSTVDIAARAKVSLDSKVENFGGFPGSSYAVFAVAQWDDMGFRKIKSVASIISITVQSKYNWTIIGGCGLFVVLAFLLYFFVFRVPKES